MRFRFCGDLDCPDWVLAEIATLSRITFLKLKSLCSHVVGSILGDEINYEKVNKLTTDAKYDTRDVKASIAVLLFIFTSAAKHSVDEESLSNELQQLGLPKEHASALCKVFADKFHELQQKLKHESLKLTHLENINWRVDYVLWSSILSEVNDPAVHLSMKIKGHNPSYSVVHNFNVTSEKFLVLLYELKQAYSLMEGVA